MGVDISHNLIDPDLLQLLLVFVTCVHIGSIASGDAELAEDLGVGSTGLAASH